MRSGSDVHAETIAVPVKRGTGSRRTGAMPRNGSGVIGREN